MQERQKQHVNKTREGCYVKFAEVSNSQTMQHVEKCLKKTET